MTLKLSSTNLTKTILNLVNSNKDFPLVITNKELPIIEESAYIIDVLEDNGYIVETFNTIDSYGIRVNK